MNLFGVNKEFGIARKEPNQDAGLILGANNPKDRSLGVYVSLNNGDDYSFGRFDVDLIPSIIEHLQGIYDGFEKVVYNAHDELMKLPSGTRFGVVTAEYIKLGDRFFYLKDGREHSLTGWASWYRFEVIK